MTILKLSIQRTVTPKFKDKIFEFAVNRPQKQSKQKYTATDKTFIWIAYVCEDGESHPMIFTVNEVQMNGRYNMTRDNVATMFKQV